MPSWLPPLLVGGVFAVLGFLAKARIERLESDLEAEGRRRTEEQEKARRAHEALIEREREGRERDRHDLRDEIQVVAGRLSAFELVVAKECINADRLREALEPLTTGMAGFRTDIKELFGKLDRKVDKAGAD